MNETEKFLKDTEQKDEKDIFDIPLDTKIDEKKIDENPELADESVKDRRHRRLEAKLQAEREANIAMSARLQTIAEAKKSEDTPSEYLKNVEKIYGTDSPESIAATELLKSALKGVKEEAKQEALDEFRKEREASDNEASKEDGALESMLDDIEDGYNVDLTSEKAKELRVAFFKTLERVSPKDDEGNVTHYADHRAVWEDMQSRLNKRTENRAKDLSDRSMVKSGASDSKVQDDATLRFLKENGIV